MESSNFDSDDKVKNNEEKHVQLITGMQLKLCLISVGMVPEPLIIKKWTNGYTECKVTLLPCLNKDAQNA